MIRYEARLGLIWPLLWQFWAYLEPVLVLRPALDLKLFLEAISLLVIAADLCVRVKNALAPSALSGLYVIYDPALYLLFRRSHETMQDALALQ